MFCVLYHVFVWKGKRKGSFLLEELVLSGIILSVDKISLCQSSYFKRKTFKKILIGGKLIE